MSTIISRHVVATLAVLSICGGASAQWITSTWTGGAAEWSTPGKWSDGVPNNNAPDLYVAVIDNNGHVWISDAVYSVMGLGVMANSSLHISSGGLHIQGGYIYNESIVQLDNLLYADSDMVLAGSGSLVGDGILASLTGSSRITNNPSHRIAGSVNIGIATPLRLTNQGLIEATVGEGIFCLLDSGANVNFNTGTIRSNGAPLMMLPCTLENEGGVVEALGGSFVSLFETVVNGGIVRDADGPDGPSQVRASGQVTFDGVTLEGGLRGMNGSTVKLVNSNAFQGVLVLDGTNQFTRIIFDNPITLSAGEIKCSASPMNLILSNPQSLDVHLANGFLLHGAATVGMDYMRLTNAGVIDADALPEMTIDLSDGAGLNFNTGIMRASNGAKLTLSDLTLENAGGLIEAGPNSTVAFAGAIVNSGTLRDADGAGPGTFNFDGATLNGVMLEDEFYSTGGSGALANATLEGDFHALSGSTTHMKDSINILGSMHLDAGRSNADVVVDSVAFVLAGGGEVIGAGPSGRLYGGDSSVRITNGATNTIRGSLNLGADQCRITNDGTIHVDSPLGMTIDPFDIFDFSNNGTLWVEHGDLAIPGGNFLNKGGTVRVDAGRTLTHTGGNGYQQLNGGTTIVDGTFAITASTFKVTTGALKGSGTVSAFVVNSAGIVAPGSSAGTLTCNDYSQNSNGTLDVEIGGRGAGTQHDQLKVVNNANLNGTLKVKRISGFVPSARDEFTILTAGAVNGAFAAIDSCDDVTVIYGSNFVKIKIAASGAGADLNSDGDVNAADLAILLGAWGACASACCAPDLNGDGAVDAADLAILLGSWG